MGKSVQPKVEMFVCNLSEVPDWLGTFHFATLSYMAVNVAYNAKNVV